MNHTPASISSKAPPKRRKYGGLALDAHILFHNGHTSIDDAKILAVFIWVNEIARIHYTLIAFKKQLIILMKSQVFWFSVVYCSVLFVSRNLVFRKIYFQNRVFPSFLLLFKSNYQSRKILLQF